MAEQSIRVSARADLSQLRSGLKTLKSDLTSVLSEIDKGARRGGLFDESQSRALDIFKRRFKETWREVSAEFKRQNDLIDEMYEKMRQVSRWEQEDIRKTIREREKELDVLRKQVIEMERIYSKRMRETTTFQRVGDVSATPSGEAAGGGGMGGATSFFLGGLSGRLTRRLMGVGSFLMGLAGIGGIMSLVSEAYQLSYARYTNSLDLAQRIRGSAGRFGSATQLYDQASAIGRRDRMGYTAAESWQFLDMYSRLAGGLAPDQQYRLMKFGRAYGLNISEVAGTVGQNVQLGGGRPEDFANAIAASVSRSGMTARILEVMETNNALLQQLNTTFKDGSNRQILAYQTVLDQIGMRRGMMQLTGAQGANIISGLAGIFSPTGDDKWKWIGIQALKLYKPEKYGNMDLFDLEMAFEDGLMNPDNIAAMAQYIRGKTGGNEKLAQRILQRWLIDGGFVATKRQAQELWEATNGLRSFDPAVLERFRNASVDAGAKYDQERKMEPGQGFLDIEARFQKALETFGNQFVESVMGFKDGVTNILEKFGGKLDEVVAKFGEFLQENGLLLAGATAGMAGLAIAMERLRSALERRAKNFIDLDPDPMKPGSQSAKKKTTSKGKTILKNVGKEALKIARGLPLVSIGLGGLEAYFDEEKHDEIAAKVGVKNPDWFSRTFASAYDNLDGIIEMFTGKNFLTKEQYYKGLKWFQNFWPGFGSEFGAGNSEIGRMPDYIEQFSEEGKERIQYFTNYNTSEFDTFREDSLKHFGSIDKEAKTRFLGMFNAVSTHMKKIYDEHKGIKSMLYFMFNPIVSMFQNLGGMLSGLGTGSSSFGSGYDVTMMSGVTAAQLNAKLGGKLRGTGELFIKYGMKYGIDPAVLAAIAMHETGNGTSSAVIYKNNVGGMMGRNGLMSFPSLEAGIEAMARNLRKNYVDKGIRTIGEIQKKYAPIGAANDPMGLNYNWTSGVLKFLNDFGISPGRASFFSGWQSRVTSLFGSKEAFRSKAHGGLDIAGKQGQPIEAITGGVIEKIYFDDGSARDSDRRKNTRAGGTEVIIRMPDGRRYFYSHLSAVNPNLRVGSIVKAGDWIGNVGGKPGAPGSGYSTTGSHLHLGYMDERGVLMDPMELLRGLAIGDSSIGRMPSQATRTDINVNLTVSGEGAKVLNQATRSQLEALVKKIITEYERTKLLMNPTKVGYGT